jgi:hypothetical protein
MAWPRKPGRDPLHILAANVTNRLLPGNQAVGVPKDGPGCCRGGRYITLAGRKGGKGGSEGRSDPSEVSSP